MGGRGNPYDRIVADLKLDNGVGPVGKNATAAITATNFLGQKRVELSLGDTRNPARSGAVVPAANVTTPTDRARASAQRRRLSRSG